MNVYVPSKGPDDWQQLLAEPEKHWRQGFSAQAVALSWESAAGVPAEIDRLFGGNTELLLAIPEHKVALPGRGKPSQCDVFALIRQNEETIAVAVEGKVNEPFGPTVMDWLGAAASDSAGARNRHVRLAGLSALLELDSEIPGHLYYQLLHRSAAAVVESRRFKTDAAAIIVQSFSPTSMWLKQFEEFSSFLDLYPVREGLGVKRLSDDRRLYVGWAQGDPKFLEGAPGENHRLYDEDFFAWTQNQGARLHNRATGGIDWENVAEEIESLGRSEKYEIESRLQVLLCHLLKYKHQASGRSSGWRGTIREQRNRLLRRLKDSPSLKNYPSEILGEEYTSARLKAAEETGLPEATFPEQCPFTIVEMLDREFLPE